MHLEMLLHRGAMTKDALVTGDFLSLTGARLEKSLQAFFYAQNPF